MPGVALSVFLMVPYDKEWDSWFLLILKLISQDISIPLSKIINLSSETGVFSEVLKIEKFVPIFKKGSLLWTKFLYSCQYGFSKSLSNSHYPQHQRAYTSKGQFACGTFCQLYRKHLILLIMPYCAKNWTYGICDVANKWIQSYYLSSRYQFVSMSIQC